MIIDQIINSFYNYSFKIIKFLQKEFIDIESEF